MIPPIKETIERLLEGTVDMRSDSFYRPLMAESLKVLGYPEADIKQALDSLYKVN